MIFIFQGTSASTPTFAGIISLINDVRLGKGLRSLGFINSKLYQIAKSHPGIIRSVLLDSISYLFIFR